MKTKATNPVSRSRYYLSVVLSFLCFSVGTATFVGCQLPEAVGGKAKTPTIEPPGTSAYTPNSVDPKSISTTGSTTATGDTAVAGAGTGTATGGGTGTGSTAAEPYKKPNETPGSNPQDTTTALADTGTSLNNPTHTATPDTSGAPTESVRNPQYANPYRGDASSTKPKPRNAGDQVGIPVTAYRTDSGQRRSTDFDQQNPGNEHDSDTGSVYVAPEM
ncbi:MAG: hypothetical protein ACRC2T_18635 [Thermoguttaceae bacterium]